jgi:hypothetical protein
LWTKSPVAKLSFNRANFEDNEMIDLSKSSILEKIEGLELRENKFGEEGLRSFIQSGKTLNLKRLHLGGNHSALTTAMLKELCDCKNFPSLEVLNIVSNGLNRNSIQEFGESPYFPNLKELTVAHVSVREHGRFGCFPESSHLLRKSTYMSKCTVWAVER